MTLKHHRYISIPPILTMCSICSQVNITFQGNTANIGPAVYINQLDLCSWYKLAPPFFDRAGVLQWPFVNFTNDNQNLGHLLEDRYNRSLYVQSPPVTFAVETPGISVFPGETFAISVSSLDELEHRTSSVIRINDISVAPAKRLQPRSLQKEITYYFIPQLLVFSPGSDQAAFHVELNTENVVTANSIVTLSIYDAYAPQSVPISKQVPYVARSCPPGYSFGETHPGGVKKECFCDTASTPDLLSCDPEGLLVSEHIWTTVVDHEGTSTVHGYKCLTGYCKLVKTSSGVAVLGSFYNYSNPDSQCRCGRRGILCGECPDGYGVSALYDRCVTCNNAQLSLTIVLVVVVVVVCIAIVVLSRPLPVWLYPCLFYSQILPFIAKEFPVSFRKVHRLLHYFSNALALYFPYDFCLYTAMSPLVSYSLKYLPLLAVIVSASIVVFIRHKTFRPIAWHGVWSLVILMYSHVVYTSMTILNCPNIGDYGNRWYVDGSVRCFQGYHIPLGLLAVVVLSLATLLIPLTTLIALNVLRKPYWLQYVFDSLAYAFKVEYRWFVGVELGRRTLLLLFAVAFPGVPVVTALVLMVVIAIYLFVQPYKSTVANVLEAILSIDTLFLFLLASDVAIYEEFVLDPATKFGSLSYDEARCPDPLVGLTQLAKMLTVFYYIPLVVLIIALSCAVVIIIR